MEKSNNPFRKAGIALLAMGTLDIGLMIYFIFNKISYSSSFNILAVIAGILLIKGSVATARLVRWLSAFFVITFTGMFFVFSVVMPIDLLMVQIKLDPAFMLGAFTLSLLFTGILFWVYRQLSLPDALVKLGEAGYRTGKPRSAVYSAIALIAIFGVLFVFLFNSKSTEKAISLAKEQMGENYKYHISRLSMSGDSGSAVVIAYNKNEILNVYVEW